MFKEMKESINLAKHFKNEQECKYNGQTYIGKYIRVPVLRLVLIFIALYIIAMYIIIDLDYTIEFPENTKQIIVNNKYNNLFETIITICLVIASVIAISGIARLFWELMYVIRKNQYSDDFEIIGEQKKQIYPLRKKDYIIGIFFSLSVVTLAVMLLDMFVKYNVFLGAYCYILLYIILTIIIAGYLCFKKCEYILLANRGYVYLTKKEK